MIKQLASGIYTYMPFGLRSIRKIERIIRQELDRAGCIELLMPSVQPAELWKESDRWKHYGKELLRMSDRKDNDFCYGPTHEEVVTDVVRREVRSYRELPLNLYQIQTKFRDEIRPRFGLMRGREFVMKDAYSFDVDEESCDRSYWQMYEAYKRIFERCGLDFRPVEADSGLIGGDYTHEFHVLAQSGEDEILSCDQCDYAANVERCDVRQPAPFKGSQSVRPKLVATPGSKTIEAVAELLGVTPAECVKALLFETENAAVVAFIRGDRTLNETALRNALGVAEMWPMEERRAMDLGITPGYVGPIDLPSGLSLWVDPEVLAMEELVVGANQVDAHYRLVSPDAFGEGFHRRAIRLATVGEPCPRCDEGRLASWRGIEVGQVFKLKTKYSCSMGADYLDADGKSRPMVMGCYGIGVTRTMAAAIEQNHDPHGIIWPVQIAPFHVTVISLDVGDEAVDAAAERVYGELQEAGVEVLYDDRLERPGFKFKDADLLGIPIQLVFGKRSLNKGDVDLKIRWSGEKRSVPLTSCVQEACEALRQLGWD